MIDLPEDALDVILEKVIPEEDFLGKAETIFDNPAVAIKTFEVEKESNLWVGIFYKDENVVVLPYRTNEHGMINEVGILKEFNPIRENNYSDTLVTGGKNDKDETSLDTAKRELLEETGYSVEDEDKWIYLGLLTTSKMIDCNHPCYAVNLNDLMAKKIDKESIESLSKFKFVPLNQVIKSTDGFILSLILKFFVANYSKVFTIEEK